MLQKIQSIRVVPNPYTYLDEDGDPCGLVSYEPVQGIMPALLGARAKSVQTMDNYPVGYFLSPRTNKKYEYSTIPTEVQLSHYYRELVRGGELLAADEASAKLCDVPYVEIKEALARAAEKAARHCFAGYGMFPNWYVEPKTEVVKAKTVKELGLCALCARAGIV